jgi:hypothetical protein
MKYLLLAFVVSAFVAVFLRMRGELLIKRDAARAASLIAGLHRIDPRAAFPNSSGPSLSPESRRCRKPHRRAAMVV